MEWKQRRARDVMSPSVTLLDEEASLAEALDVLREARVSGAPVADDEGQILGVLSVFDVLAWLTDDLDPVEHPGSFFLRGTIDWDAHSEAWARAAAADPRAQERSVKATMDREVVAVGPDLSLPEVLGQLLERRIHRVLVVDGDGLAGVLTVHDLLRAVAAD